jgi:tetratricopeptide (TPR) repeat protein
MTASGYHGAAALGAAVVGSMAVSPGEDNSVPPLESARTAFARREWASAYALTRPLAEAGALAPDDEVFFAEACALALQHDDARRAFERAVVGFERQGRAGEAAHACVQLWRASGDRGNRTAALGWLGRAERFAGEAGDHPAVGHVALARGFVAHMSGHTEEALGLARDAHAVARRHGDVALEALALNRMGRASIRLGQVEEGQARIDEAMALVTADAVPLLDGFLVYCNTIDACADVADWRRAADWTAVASDWCDRNRLASFAGVCRVHRAELLRIRGAWELAAREIRAACDDLAQQNMEVVFGWGLCELGIQRLAVGDLSAAEEAFRQAHARGSEAQPGLAQLWIRQGKAPAAVAALERALADCPDRPLARAKLLPTLVEAAIAGGTPDRAVPAAEELERIARQFPSAGLRAQASSARGAERLASGDPAGAGRALREAIRAWHEVGAPYEVARARCLLARTLEAEGDLESAAFERDAAREAFTRLGAAIEFAPTLPPSAAPTLAAAAVGPKLAADAIGRLIGGKLELLRKLGEGGMGRVYAARHRLLGRDVAVKLLRAGACADPQHCQRLLQEAMASAQVRHPNVVEVYDAGVEDGEPYLVLELLEGESVAAHLAARGPLPLRDALGIVGQAIDGVAAAHERAIVHRDLKPDNLFLCAGERLQVKVLDFGIAKLEDGAGVAQTKTGALAGTPHYMAPEQVEGRRDLDARVDVYALGIVLFELLTGSPPFAGDSYGSILLSIMTGEFPSCREARPELPDAVDEVLARATARKRDQRFASVAELGEALAGLRANLS